jgi:hypothetical protein
LDKAPRDIAAILNDVKALASEYHTRTGKPLGVTGEIAEFEAARLLGLTLEDARSPGYDAIRTRDGETQTIQIKGRWKRAGAAWGRVSAINTDKPFDIVMLVLMRSDEYEVHEIWEADRDAVIARLDAPGSKSRNERRSMGVAQFKTIARRVWPDQD